MTFKLKKSKIRITNCMMLIVIYFDSFLPIFSSDFSFNFCVSLIFFNNYHYCAIDTKITIVFYDHA
jgi:hypothetical protein